MLSFLSDFPHVCLQSWLRRYGYLPQASRQMSTMRSAQILSNAISDMQRFYGLEVTGHMDPETIRSAGLNRDVFERYNFHCLSGSDLFYILHKHVHKQIPHRSCSAVWLY